MQRKVFPFALQKANNGEFSGYASTFGNVDSQKDVVMPGAFAKAATTRSTPFRSFLDRLGR